MSNWYPIQDSYHFHHSAIRSISVSAFAAVFVAIGLVGCRGTWNPSTQLRSEPSFDRLLELESSSESDDSDSGSTSLSSFNERGQVHPKVAQRRPGTRAAASRYSDVDVGHEVSPASFNESDSITSPTSDQPARRRISDRGSDDPSEQTDEHSDLLQQTQNAIKNRYRTELQSATNSPPRSVPFAEFQAGRATRPQDSQPSEVDARLASNPEKGDSAENSFGHESDNDPESNHVVTIRMNDRPNPHAADPTVNSEDAQPHIVEAAHHTMDTGNVALVQPAVHNRYRNQQGIDGSELTEPEPPSAAENDLTWQQHLEVAMQQLSQTSMDDDSVVANPKVQVRQAVIVRLLAMALGNREQMLNEVEGLQAQEQEYLKYQLTALMDAIDPEGNPVSSRRWSLVMLNQRKASEHLSSLANLEVNNLAFCTEVESFGVAERFSQYRFTPDQEVLLYCEIDNFSSDRSSDGKGYETQLQGSYEIVDSSGKRVADQSLPMDTHICRNLRRDYFIAYRIYLPQNISPGSYSLRLTIEDMKGHKFGQSEVAFQIQ